MLQHGWIPKPVWVPSVVWAENILIRSQYLNPVGYSPEKTLSMGIALLLTSSPPLFFFFKPSGGVLNLKNEKYNFEVAR